MPLVLIDHAQPRVFDLAAKGVAQHDELHQRKHHRHQHQRRRAEELAQLALDNGPHSVHGRIPGRSGMTKLKAFTCSSRSCRPVKWTKTSSSVVFCTESDFTCTLERTASSTSSVVVFEPLLVRMRYMFAASGCTEVTSSSFCSSLLPVRRRVQELRFDDVGSRHAGLQRGRRIERHQLAVIDDGDAVAQAVGFVHVVRGDQDGERAAVLDLGQHLPDGDARDGIEAGGRLVEEEDLRAVHQAARDLQTAPHAAGERLGLRVAPLRADRPWSSSSSMLRLRSSARHAVELGVDVQVLFDGQIDVAGHRLRNHAHAVARVVGLLGDVEAVDEGATGGCCTHVFCHVTSPIQHPI